MILLDTLEVGFLYKLYTICYNLAIPEGKRYQGFLLSCFVCDAPILATHKWVARTEEYVLM